MKLKTQLLETQTNLARLRAHVRKSTAQHKSDIRSSKFAKRGPIFIPMEPDVNHSLKLFIESEVQVPPPPTHLPDNIILENVVYDPSGNEMFEIGSDVDDIELDTSLTLDAGPTITEEDDLNEKKSKKSKKSKKEPKDQKKDQPKTDKKDAKSHKSGNSPSRSKKSKKSTKEK